MDARDPAEVGGAARREPDRLRLALGQHPLVVAPTLLGATLTSDLGDDGPVILRLTEVEAYGGLGEDPGSHAHRRRTARNDTMFGPCGHAYVYFTYGMHWCLNVVAHAPGVAGAVLLRAGRVTAGLDAARLRRPTARRDHDLARGPARLAAALGVTGAVDGLDLLDPTSPLRLAGLSGDRIGRDRIGPADAVPRADHGGGSIRTGPRTGVAGDGAGRPWRFWLADEPTVSPHRPAAPRRRTPG